jgi:hypothetical protein
MNAQFAGLLAAVCVGTAISPAQIKMDLRDVSDGPRLPNNSNYPGHKGNKQNELAPTTEALTRGTAFTQNRGHSPETTWGRETGDLQLLGLHPFLWATPQDRDLHRLADHCEEAYGCEAQNHQGRASTP